jgi:hypothetical protein
MRHSISPSLCYSAAMPPIRDADFEDDRYSFRVRRIMYLGGLADEASWRNRPLIKFGRRILYPVWITLAIFVGTLFFVIGYSITITLF